MLNPHRQKEFSVGVIVFFSFAGDRGVYPLGGRPVQRHGEAPELHRGAGVGEQSVDSRLCSVERSAGGGEQGPDCGGGQCDELTVRQRNNNMSTLG